MQYQPSIRNSENGSQTILLLKITSAFGTGLGIDSRAEAKYIWPVFSEIRFFLLVCNIAPE
jgi:hypothetical protein